MKRYCCILFLILLFIGCSDTGENGQGENIERKITKIKIIETQKALAAGDTYKLTVQHTPADLPAPVYAWSSSNEQVVTVVNGLVTAVTPGAAIVYVTMKDSELKDSWSVIVKEVVIAATKITLSQMSLDLPIGESTSLVAIVEPENATVKEIVWKSSDEKVVTITGGMVTGLSVGSAVISATVKGSDISADCTVNVFRPTLERTVQVDHPGDLENLLKGDFDKITNLIVKGNIDARDLMVLKKMNNLSNLDMKQVAINRLEISGTIFNENELLEENFRNSILESVVLPKDLVNISKLAFYGCNKLENITISSKVKIIKEMAFSSCSKLYHVELPEGLSEIEEAAFNTCGIRELFVPNTVVKIGRNTFQDCKITEIKLSSNLTELAVQLFYNCSRLTNIVVPEGVRNIRANAFYGCKSLVYVDIPSTVLNFESETFYGCSELSEFHVRAKNPPSLDDRDCFYLVNKETCKLYLPKGSNQLYKLSLYWSDFKNYIEE